MSEREQILQQAMQLAPEDREYVADILAQSLGGGGFATAELADARAVEIQSRIAAYDLGELPADDQKLALDRVRQMLADFRARKVRS